MSVDQSKYYDGSALIEAPWLICSNLGVTYTYESSLYANTGCTDKCNLEVIAYCPDKITDPDAVYSGTVPSFTIQVYWTDPNAYLKDEHGSTVNCIYTEGIWTVKVLWNDNDNLLADMEGLSSPVDLLNELNIDTECATFRWKKVCELISYATTLTSTTTGTNQLTQ